MGICVCRHQKSFTFAAQNAGIVFVAEADMPAF